MSSRTSLKVRGKYIKSEIYTLLFVGIRFDWTELYLIRSILYHNFISPNRSMSKWIVINQHVFVKIISSAIRHITYSIFFMPEFINSFWIASFEHVVYINPVQFTSENTANWFRSRSNIILEDHSIYGVTISLAIIHKISLQIRAEEWITSQFCFVTFKDWVWTRSKPSQQEFEIMYVLNP